MVRGASGDEPGELTGGKGTIGLQAAVPHATFNFLFSPKGTTVMRVDWKVVYSVHKSRANFNRGN